MIRLHYSNRLENLIAPLADAVAEHQRREPLEPVTIVVPNRVVEQFVRYRLAESIGIAANLKFPFLQNYLAQLLQSTDQNLRILDVDELQLVLFECLRTNRDDLNLKPARDYIEAGSKSDADLELRTFLLAVQLARLFREYSISRRRMIEKWWAARSSDIDAMSETEQWQRHLWQSVFDSQGQVREQWLLKRESRLSLLPDAFEASDNAAAEKPLCRKRFTSSVPRTREMLTRKSSRDSERSAIFGSTRSIRAASFGKTWTRRAAAHSLHGLVVKTKSGRNSANRKIPSH